MLKEMTAVISDDGTNIRGVESKAGNGRSRRRVRPRSRRCPPSQPHGHGLRRVPGVRDVQRAKKFSLLCLTNRTCDIAVPEMTDRFVKMRRPYAASHRRRVLQGSASNLLRLLLSMVVSLALPPFLVHRMSTAEYSAWVLILQLSAYVNFLDLGISTAISKFVAEYETTGDHERSRRLVSTAFSVLCIASAIGIVAVLIVTWKVPELFHQMPPELMHDVRAGLLAIGFSTALALPFSVFISLFTGIQQYGFPTVLASVSRLGSAALLIVLVLLHGTLLQMSLLVAAFNVATAGFQFIGWHRFAQHRVPFQFLVFDRRLAVMLVEYCGVLAIWTLGALLISGLDTTIVGHFDYRNTGFYAIASSATNFMLLFSPTSSARSFRRSPPRKLSAPRPKWAASLSASPATPLSSFVPSRCLSSWVGSRCSPPG